MKKTLVCILLGASIFISLAHALPAIGVDEGELDAKKKKIEELQTKLQEVQGQKQTLSQTINYLTTKISLTETQIDQTESEIKALEREIEDLTGKIEILNTSLSKLSLILINRVNAAYRNAHTKPMYLLLSSEGFNDFFKRYKYLKVSQQHDREMMFALETARTDFDNQKTLKEEKQIEVTALQDKLVQQESTLEKQQQDKQKALDVTKNNEKNYQQQLATALAELQAIQSIIAGRGNENEVRQVNQGETIASVIPGPSACSNGAHLHFEVAKAGVHINPASYLSEHNVTWDNGPDGPFGFSGEWAWPLNDPIRITQGYGMTFYAATLRYYGGSPHTGIDMVNLDGNHSVKAVKSGTLYRGGIACGGGTLRYVRVDHADDGYSTYYLHINY